jgi:short-subunit dehydrogenase
MNTAPLRERVVVVTGAAGGIGAALARRLADAGARLVLADRTAGALAGLRDELERRTAVVTAGADLRNADAARALATQAVAPWGRVDAVVHCAAVVHPGAFAAMSDAALRCQIESNIWGPVHVARAFIPVFAQQRAGHLVLFASLGGAVPMPGEAAYCMTKWAVRGLAFSLALELRKVGIDVSVISPDSTRTAMLDIEARDDGAALSFSNPPLDPDTVASAVVRTLLAPRLEVLVPGARGMALRLLGAFPGLFAPLLPPFDRAGRRRRARYRATLPAAAPPARCHEPTP